MTLRDEEIELERPAAVIAELLERPPKRVENEKLNQFGRLTASRRNDAAEQMLCPTVFVAHGNSCPQRHVESMQCAGVQKAATHMLHGLGPQSLTA